MRDISLHVMDILQNSISAQAKLIQIRMNLDGNGMLALTVEDDGTGMSPELLEKVQSPFTTTRTERKVGLGLPLLLENARRTGGGMWIKSSPGAGTTVTATFDTGHIDCLPMGDLMGTLLALLIACPDSPDFVFGLYANGAEATLDTRELKVVLDGVPLNEPEVIDWVKTSLGEEIQQVFGGTDYEIHR